MTSKAYVLDETTILVNGETGADIVLSGENVAGSAGRVSAVKDWGASAHAFLYGWVCEVQWQTGPGQFATLDLYLAEYDESGVPPADIGTADAALGPVEQLRNLRYLGSVVVEANDTTKMVASGTYLSTKRYHQWVIYNTAASSINATDTNFVLKITPRSIQGQAT